MGDLDLYNFVDNHDLERIYTKLSNKAHFAPIEDRNGEGGINTP